MATDAITMFKEAAAQLQKEAVYLELDNARQKNDDDENLQEVIGSFNLARIDLNSELSKGADKDAQKVADLNEKVNEMYGAIMENENMAEYNATKGAMETLMNHINAILNTAVNGGDPMIVEAPEASCSGSCSSCSGCH